MLRISKVALAAALFSSASGLVLSTPAAAKDPPKEEGAAPAFKFSSGEVLTAVQAAKTAVEARNPAAAEPLVAQVEALVKNDDDRYVAAALRSDLEQQKVDAAVAAGQKPDRSALSNAYNVLLTSPKTPQTTKAEIAYSLGALYYNSKQYPQAITYLQQAQQLGSVEPTLSATIVRAKMFSGDAQGSLAELNRLIDMQVQQKGKADDELYRFAISKTVQAKDGAGTLAWMRKYLTAYPTPKNWRDMIKIYGLQPGSFITPTDSQALDLYRLMRATNALADQYDYENYADRARKTGLPYETKTVIAEGRAKGKIPASSTTATALLKAATSAIASEGSLAPLEAKAKTAADGRLAAQTGDAQLGSGNYAKAIELYWVALQKGGANANDVNTRLGIALALTGDRAGAKTAFGAVAGAPSADIAALWTTYVDSGAPGGAAPASATSSAG